MNNQRKFRGGSLPIFIVVAALMTIVLLGGLYALQRYSSNLEKAGEEIATNTEDLTNTDDSDKQNEDQKASEAKKEEADKKVAQNNAAEAEKKRAEEAARKEAEVKAQESEARQQEQARQDSEAEQHSEELPETGPTETLMQLIAISFISFASVSYYRSRRSH